MACAESPPDAHPIRARLATFGVAAALCLAPGVVQAKGLSMSRPFGAGQIERTGPALYPARCGGCHALDHNRYGPSHDGVLGRTAGTRPDYRYSDALRRSGIVWTETTLDAWITDPRRLVPGTRMDARVLDPEERHLIIEYLSRSAQRSAGPFGAPP